MPQASASEPFSLFVATPSLRGSFCKPYVLSIVDLQNHCLRHGIDEEALQGGRLYEFFERVHTETGAVGEDFYFCDLAHAHGGEVLGCPWVQTSHVGQIEVIGHPKAIARVRGTLLRDSGAPASPAAIGDVDSGPARSSLHGRGSQCPCPHLPGVPAMRFVAMVKATAASEAGELPSEKLLTDMGRFNEELVKAGVLLAAEGLHPSRNGVRIRYEGDSRTVIDGPFTETKELVAGFWLLQLASLDEAIEWMKRAPNPFEQGASEVEIRRVFEAEDFGAEFTPELREQEAQLRARIGDTH